MRNTDLFASEGYCIDDYGNMISTVQVDFRPSADRLLIGQLVKVSRAEYALDVSNSILISKPSRFHEQGQGLIRDPAEATITQVTEDTEPHPLLEELTQDFSNALHKLVLEHPEIFTAYSITTEHRRRITDTINYGKNGWIFCAAIMPEETTLYEGWKASMPAQYDTITQIYRPTLFARALGFMVAEQLGARGQIGDMSSSLNDGEAVTSKHPLQVVVHGPVVYTDDPWALVHQLKRDEALLAASLFVKRAEFRPQQEYRFVVWTEEEPEEESVELEISGMLRDSLQPLHIGRSF